MVKDTIRISVFQGVNLATNLVLLTLIARHLGVVQYGQIGFALAYSALASQLIELGLGVSFVRAYSQARGRQRRVKLLASYLVVAARRLLLAAPAAAIIYAMSFGIKNIDTAILISIGLLVAINFLILIAQSFRQAMDQYGRIAAIYIASSVARAGACLYVLVVAGGLDVTEVLIIQVLVWFVTLILSAGSLIPPLVASWTRLGRAARRLEHRSDDIQFGRNVKLFNLVSLLLNRLDYIVVKVALGDVALGLYYFIQQVLAPISTVFSSIVLRVNNQVMRLVDAAKARDYIRKALLGGGAMFLLCLAGSPLVVLAINHFLPSFSAVSKMLPIAIASFCAAGTVSLVNLIYNRLNKIPVMMALSIAAGVIFFLSATAMQDGNVRTILIIQLLINLALILVTTVLTYVLAGRLGR